MNEYVHIIILFLSKLSFFRFNQTIFFLRRLIARYVD